MSVQLKAPWGTSRPTAAFTLIELVVVLAVLGFLSAVALVNMHEAQVRAKLSRVRGDMRSLSVAIEAYMTDNGRYPFGQHFGHPSPWQKLRQVTTPIAYITSVPADPFHDPAGSFAQSFAPERADTYLYNSGAAEFALGLEQTAQRFQRWSLTNTGPDRVYQFSYYAFADTFVDSGRHVVFIYDPTNGTTSGGDIFRRGGYNAGNTPEIGPK